MREERRESAAPTRKRDLVAARGQRCSTSAWRRVLSSLFSLPVLLLGLTPGCDPGTTRPELTPFPEARIIEVFGDRDSAISVLQRALRSDSIPIARVSVRDHWLESPWFDALTLAPTGNGAVGAGVVKLRGWADPSRQGASLLTVELVYRPMADPSIAWRELERPVPSSDSIFQRVGRVLKQVTDSVGAHFGDTPRR